MRLPALVPELSVSNISRSLAFYCDLLGFALRYQRVEEGFAFLDLGQAGLMLDQSGVGRDWVTGPLEKPFGRGINLQIQFDDLAPVLGRLAAAQTALFASVEVKTYPAGEHIICQRQFCVQDPDGYLLRCCQLLARDNPDGMDETGKITQ